MSCQHGGNRGSSSPSGLPVRLTPPGPRDDMTNEPASEPTARLAACLEQLHAGDDVARGEILALCDARLRELSHRLLGKFAKVRRWDDTDDVAQNAALRLYRALADTVPDSPRGLMGLMSTQIQRELIDLARKHSGPMSYAAKVLIERWRQHYNTIRPHSALGYRPPAPEALQPCAVATAAPPQPHRAGLLEGKTLT